MSRSRYWALAALGLLGCAGDDVTTLRDGAARSESGAPMSQTLELLGEPDTVDVACRLVGVAVANLGSPGPDPASTCEAAVDDCHDALVGFDGAGGVELPDSNVGALLGCELTLAQLDACLAGVLGRARDAYAGSLSCDAAPAAGVDALGLLASPACLIVGLRCPQLLTSLGAL